MINGAEGPPKGASPFAKETLFATPLLILAEESDMCQAKSPNEKCIDFPNKLKA